LAVCFFNAGCTSKVVKVGLNLSDFRDKIFIADNKINCFIKLCFVFSGVAENKAYFEVQICRFKRFKETKS